MARLFDDASLEGYRTAAAVTAMPLTIAAWFYLDDAASFGTIVGASSEDDNAFHGWWLTAYGSAAGNIVAARTFGGLSVKQADTTTGPTTNTWHHACAVFASATSRSAYIDGGSKGTNTDSETASSINNVSIGRTYYYNSADNVWSGSYSGAVAEVGIWNVALTDSEIAILGNGYSPLFVRPQSLVFYAPLIRTVLDRIDNKTFTANGSPAVAAHPAIIYPAQVYQSFSAAGAPPAGPSIPVFMHHYRQQGMI